ncbi:MAG: type VI secretion system contractile sheath large subunit [Deltaproteobacteria bacterium]|nr:type VI secretion system contractile sheath large subunit [Deltaproteobacteria bacterium]
MTENEKTEVQGAAAEEMSALESLFSKVDMAVPTDKIDLKNKQSLEPSAAKLSVAVNHFLHAIATSGTPIEKLDKVVVDATIAEIDKKLSEQIAAIMHHEKFQEMESAWRSLKFLVDKTNFRRNIKIEMINISKQSLAEDFEDAPEPVQSGLYKQVYTAEYDQPGGEPFGAVISNYTFGRGPMDIELMQNVAKISAATHCPFIAAVGADFFGLKSIDKLPAIPDLASIFEQAEYAKWNGFRDSEDSRYLGLTVPRFLLRLPYGKATIPVKEFDFEEDVKGEDHDKYLWGNASFAFASKLTESFAQHGWCVNIRGPQAGGLVEDLPIHVFESGGDTETKVPTEILISDRREFEFAQQGLISLSFYKNKNYACFFSAQSAQRPAKYSTAEATANAKLSANLPYLFLVSRLAHYLKVIQRENIGAAKEADDLHRELATWIEKLVTKMPNPGAELKARCPLADASIEVLSHEDNPGFYSVAMKVRPHFQIEGVNVDLSLVSQMPKGK